MRRQRRISILPELSLLPSEYACQHAQLICKASHAFKHRCQNLEMCIRAILKCNFSPQTEGPSVFMKEAPHMLSTYKIRLRARCKIHYFFWGRDPRLETSSVSMENGNDLEKIRIVGLQLELQFPFEEQALRLHLLHIVWLSAVCSKVF